ncbi:MAG TPA: IclR family transcriptional regulator [Thermodesulfobacteriota bacterium]|nr:IclR family transcriptional regulator [Thermodesulfobacteriota bacterium]
MPQDKTSTFYNRSLERALQILNVFTRERNSLTLSQLSEILGLSRATVLRLCTTLVQYGFLHQDLASKEYALGLRLFELGSIVLHSFSLRKTASPFLDRLHQKLGKTLFLGILEEGQLVYIDKREDLKNLITFTSKIGTRRPPYWGMVGPMLMAHLPDPEVHELLKKYPLTATTKKSFTKNEEFKKWLSRIRKEGYAVDEERTFDGITGLAVPIYDFREKVVASLAVCFITSAVDSTELKRIIKEARRTGMDISREIGYPKEKVL